MKKLSQFLKVMLVAGCVLLNSVAVYATDANTTGASTTPAAAATTNAATGTITVQNAAKTKRYGIYRLFDATVSANGQHIAYRLRPGKNDLGEAGSNWFEIDTAGNITAKDILKQNQDIFQTTEFIDWAKAYGEKVGEDKEATGTALTFNNVPYGYYLITSDLGAVVTVDSTKPDVVINDKNTQKPSIKDDPTYGKNVVGITGPRKTTYAVGDLVPFRFKFTAVNFETVNKDTKQIASYKVVDTPTHLSIVQGSLKVKVDGQLLADNKYTVNIDNGVMTVVIPWADSASQNAPLYNSPVDVELNYNALVTAGAADNPAKNVANLTYRYVGDNPTDPTSDKPVTDPHPNTPDNPKDPVIQTYKITLSKVDGEDNNIALTGAEFKLYDAQEGGTEIKLVKVNDQYRVAEKNAQGNVTEEGNGVNVVAGTNIIIKGLKGSTTYYLEEVKAPNGYNKLRERKVVKTETGSDATLAPADVSVNVENNRGAELPSTGGMGRTIFYIIGIFLLVAVVITMISRMKMKSMNA